MAAKGRNGKARSNVQSNPSARQAAEGRLLAQEDAQPTPPVVPVVEVPADPEIPKSSPGDIQDPTPANIVQNAAQSTPPGDEPEDDPKTAIVVAGVATEWVWTKVKRRALELTMEGVPVGQIADKLGKHRNTIRNWWHSPEFKVEVQRRMSEYTTSMKLRQTHRTSVLGEALYTKATRLMAEALAAGGKLNIGESQFILRELRDYQREEREVTGGTVARVEHRVLFEGGGETAEAKKDSASARSFHEFLKEHVPHVTSLKALPADASPQDGLIEVAAELMQATDLLDKIGEEDRITDREEAEASEAMKRKR
jgi:DNA-binding CsgD family transcriptional regulator